MGARSRLTPGRRGAHCVTVGVRQKAPAAPSPNKAASTRPAFGPAATQKPATQVRAGGRPGGAGRRRVCVCVRQGVRCHGCASSSPSRSGISPGKARDAAPAPRPRPPPAASRRPARSPPAMPPRAAPSRLTRRPRQRAAQQSVSNTAARPPPWEDPCSMVLTARRGAAGASPRPAPLSSAPAQRRGGRAATRAASRAWRQRPRRPTAPHGTP